MTSVKIGITDPNLLKWFNQFHAALLDADKHIQQGTPRVGLGRLITTTLAMVRQMGEVQYETGWSSPTNRKTGR